MNTTIRHISHLLCDRDNLAVPGLGVFRRRHISARFDGPLIMPPSEEIVFVAHDSCDDDVLVMSIARCLACDRKTAAERVSVDVTDIKARLEAGRAVDLGGVGNLVPAAALGGIVFVPSDSWSRRQPLFWLSPVEQPIEEVSAEIASDEDTERNRNIFMQSLQRTASSAAAIALLALIAFVASQLPHKSSDPQMASFGFETASHSVVVEPVEQPSVDKALVLILNTPADGMSVIDPSEKNVSAEPMQINADDTYFLIVASLASAAEADRFIAANAGASKLGILESQGRYRIYAASGSSFASTKATADSNGLFERFPSAWICRK